MSKNMYSDNYVSSIQEIQEEELKELLQILDDHNIEILKILNSNGEIIEIFDKNTPKEKAAIGLEYIKENIDNFIEEIDSDDGIKIIKVCDKN